MASLSSPRYLTLILRLTQAGWIFVRGRVHYEVMEGGVIVVKNLDGGVKRGPRGRLHLVDYTWFRKHNTTLSTAEKSFKRGECSSRFAEMHSATFEEGFRYGECAGILICWIQYDGRATFDVLNKP